jgi:hypothetical protein
VTSQDASKALANIEIVHPYGHLGPLPWQGTNGFAFGGIAGRKIIQISERIKTFYEQLQDADDMAAMKKP